MLDKIIFKNINNDDFATLVNIILTNNFSSQGSENSPDSSLLDFINNNKEIIIKASKSFSRYMKESEEDYELLEVGTVLEFWAPLLISTINSCFKKDLPLEEVITSRVNRKYILKNFRIE